MFLKSQFYHRQNASGVIDTAIRGKRTKKDCIIQPLTASDLTRGKQDSYCNRQITTDGTFFRVSFRCQIDSNLAVWEKIAAVRNSYTETLFCPLHLCVRESNNHKSLQTIGDLHLNLHQGTLNSKNRTAIDTCYHSSISLQRIARLLCMSPDKSARWKREYASPHQAGD